MEAPFGAKVPKKGRKVNDMKRLKKALALALALTVVMAFSGLSVFAADGDAPATGAMTGPRVSCRERRSMPRQRHCGFRASTPLVSAGRHGDSQSGDSAR